MAYPLLNWKTAERGYRFGDKTFYNEHHLGTDIIVPEGTKIIAPFNCRAIFSGVGEQGGNSLHIAFQDPVYGKLIVRFLHLGDLPKKKKYKEGEVMGYSGNTGSLTKGPHLHIDISKGKLDIKVFDNFIDPEIYFKEYHAPKKTVTYRKAGEEKIYALIGSTLVPFNVSLDIYKKQFPDAKIIDLDEDDFEEFLISDTMMISAEK